MKAGCFSVEFIKVSHSIDDAVAFAIKTPVGMVVHTGDFKLDLTPVSGEIMDLSRFAELGKQGVLAMLSDSTNAERPGFTMSESQVGKPSSTISGRPKDASSWHPSLPAFTAFSRCSTWPTFSAGAYASPAAA